jgi:hypothetical protein
MDVAGYLNPFAVTGGSRIPDGAVAESAALTHRHVLELNSKAPGDTIHMFMYPGLTSGLLMAITDSNDVLRSDPGIRWVDWTTDSFFKGGIDFGADPKPTNFKMDGDINRWRVVSQGIRLSLLNTMEENDGWFEACRLAYKPKMSDWEVYAPDITWDPENPSSAIEIDGEDAYFRASQELLESYKLRNLAEQRSYMLGPVRDIGRHQFHLTPYSTINDFVETTQFYELPSTANTVVPFDNPAGQDSCIWRLKDGFSQAKSVYNASVDTNWDVVYIRVKGPQVGVVNEYGTRLLVDVAANHEVCYDAESSLSKFMQPTKLAQQAWQSAAAAAKLINQKAGTTKLPDSTTP